MSSLDELLIQVDLMKEEIIQLAQDLVRIPSVNTGFMPTGNETLVCRYVEDFLAVDGIASETLERVSGRGNFIAGLSGRSGKPGLMFMSHTDVVPVEDESKWRFPPFSAQVHDGRIYGRGSNDCKGLLAAHLVAMRLLKRNGVKLRDDLLLVSGADEEHGGRYGFGWLAENHPEKITAPYAVNEGGGETIKAAGNTAYVIGVGEKGRLQIEIDFKGTSAHASVPWQGTNAAFRLGNTLQRIEKFEADRDTTTSLFDHLSTFAIEHKPSSENIDEIIAELQDDNPRLASLLRALSRMTLTPTILKGGIKSNSVPEAIRLTCDVRTLPHQDEKYVRSELVKLLDGVPGVEFEIDYMARPNASPFDTEFVNRIKRVTEQVLVRDDLQWVPGISTGFTDSRFTRLLGVETYGFSAFHPEDDPMLGKAHGTDESIGVLSLINASKVMLALAYETLSEE
jgi:acetylornithine deacetylase/succinyl-diaminopimelate desuccinylase-like protein